MRSKSIFFLFHFFCVPFVSVTSSYYQMFTTGILYNIQCSMWQLCADIRLAVVLATAALGELCSSVEEADAQG